MATVVVIRLSVKEPVRMKPRIRAQLKGKTQCSTADSHGFRRIAPENIQILLTAEGLRQMVANLDGW